MLPNPILNTFFQYKRFCLSLIQCDQPSCMDIPFLFPPIGWYNSLFRLSMQYFIFASRISRRERRPQRPTVTSIEIYLGTVPVTCITFQNKLQSAEWRNRSKPSALAVIFFSRRFSPPRKTRRLQPVVVQFSPFRNAACTPLCNLAQLNSYPCTPTLGPPTMIAG